MDYLGRYYTRQAFSNLLIFVFSNSMPGNVLELGVGSGSLVKAAIQRWLNAKYYVGDVDPLSIDRIKSELPFLKTFHIDTLNEDISKKIDLTKGTFDVAVCNPPYLKIKNEYKYNELFESANLVECKKLKLLTSDIIFLAKNLELLKNNGELGIILPDSLITGGEYSVLRAAILREHNLKCVIELPENIFSKTEALTHILLIEKNVVKNNRTPLFLSNRNGEIVEEIEVDSDALVNRMDFKFHSWVKRSTSRSPKQTLSSIGAEIKRGKLTHKELKAVNDNFIHTNGIIHGNEKQALKNSHKLSNPHKFELTQAGDILLARVGCIGKVCKISKGKSLISDCIYRIRVPQEYIESVWVALISSEGQNWLKANSQGVCAKVISKEDLLKFPI